MASERHERGNIMDRMHSPCRPRVLFINRSYWPDAEATGQLLTELCEDLTGTFDVTVIAGQPNVNPSHASFRSHGCEIRHEVRIERVRHSRLRKAGLLRRAVNYFSFLVMAVVRGLRVARTDVIVVETDPPLLCLLGRFLQRFHGAKLVVYLQDIHPDIGIAIGKFRNGWLMRTLRWMLLRVYRSADRVVVLSSDMQERMIEAGVRAERVVCIPNWIDTAKVRPCKQDNPFRKKHARNGEFVAMYSGNHGLCQRLEDVVAAASYLRDREDILFLLVGDGALKPQLRRQADELGLSNVRFLPYQSHAELAQSLSAADVHLVPLDPRVASCLMPSKFYGVLASGTPLVAIAPEDCELAELTLEHDVGVIAPPGEPEALADIVRDLSDQAWDLVDMGLRARRLAESTYDRKRITARFCELLSEVCLEAGPTRVEGEAVPARQRVSSGSSQAEHLPAKVAASRKRKTAV